MTEKNESRTEPEIKPQDDTIDFSLLLASSVHDIKNSLSTVLNAIDELISGSENHSQERKQLGSLRGETSRINNDLLYLLGLYRLQNQQLKVNIQEVYVADFLEEQIAAHQLLFDTQEINVQSRCGEHITAYFDEQLIAGVIGNILVNCAKYTKDSLILSAERLDGYVHITIQDNGEGYPAPILNQQDNHALSIDFSSGSTKLGLFFSRQIAKMHANKERQGYIRLSNNSHGGLFELFLP